MGKKDHFLYIINKAKNLHRRIKSQKLRLNCERIIILRTYYRHYLMRRKLKKLRSSYMSPAVCLRIMQRVMTGKPASATSRYVLFHVHSEPRTYETLLGYHIIIPATRTPHPSIYHDRSACLVTARSPVFFPLTSCFPSLFRRS